MPKQPRGRPALTPGKKPTRVEVLLPAATCKAIDATGRKRSEYIREAIAEKMERDSDRADRRANLDSALADICR